MRIGIIGLGKMGQNHLKELSKSENFKISALLDLNINKDTPYPFFDDVNSFLDNDLDCVIISSPTNTHLELAKACFKRVKTILIEKPLALNLKQMKELKEAAINENVALAVGFSERFNPAIIALKNELKDEEIISINIRRFSTYPFRILDVGILRDLSVHDLDLILYFLDKIPLETKLFKLGVRDKNKDDEAIINLFFDTSIASIHQSWNSSMPLRQIDIISTKAIYSADLMNFSATKNGALLSLSSESPLQAEHKEFFSLCKNRTSKSLASVDESIIIQEILEVK